MTLRRYKLYGAVGTTANAIDSTVFQRMGTVKQIIFGVTITSITANVLLRIQVSRGAISDFAGAAGGQSLITASLAQYFLSGNFVTSGLSQIEGNYIVECNDKINPGDILYLNSVAAGTQTSTVDIIIVVDE